jgi:hypothetical protein
MMHSGHTMTTSSAPKNSTCHTIKHTNNAVAYLHVAHISADRTTARTQHHRTHTTHNRTRDYEPCGV